LIDKLQFKSESVVPICYCVIVYSIIMEAFEKS